MDWNNSLYRALCQGGEVSRIGAVMIRIREIREAMGLSSNDLARRANTTGATIRRLETGAMELTVTWMTRIAEALGVAPHDLISIAAMAGIGDDVVPAAGTDTAIGKALALREMRVYRVISDAVSLSGVLPGEEHAFDESPEAIGKATAGDIVIVELQSEGVSRLGLRVFVPPALVVTNRDRSNQAIRINDTMSDVSVHIRGVLVR